MSGNFPGRPAATPRPAAPAPSGRSRTLALTVAIIGLLLVGFSVFAGFWTDRLWFDSVGFRSVFSKIWVTRGVLFLVFGVVSAAVVAAAMVLAYRSRPLLWPGVNAPSDGLDRYRQTVAPVAKWVVIATSGLVGLMSGFSAAGQWRTFLLWRNGGDFGTEDPYFGRDHGFFVFDLPWWHFVVDSVMVMAAVGLAASVLVHYLYGGIRFAARPGERVSGAAQAQIAVLLAVFAIAKAADYWLDRYDLVLQGGGKFTGMGYTDDHAVLPAKEILAGIAIVCAVLFLANVWRRTWMLPSLGVALFVLSAVILGLIVPGVVQQFQVRPNEPDKEAPYITENIAATREAFSLDDIEVSRLGAPPVVEGLPEEADEESADEAEESATEESEASAEETPAAEPAADDGEVLDLDALDEMTSLIPLVDPKIISATFENEQQVRKFYTVNEVLDVDRYEIGGNERQLVLGVRELDQTGIGEGERNWANLHTVYTHGNGVIAAYADQRPEDGSSQELEIQWAEGREGDESALSAMGDGYEDRVYFGEHSPSYSIVGQSASGKDVELDLAGLDGEGEGEETTSYDGAGGVDVGGLFHKALFAARFGEVNLLLSDRVHEDSKILYQRNPREMVEKVAPWLTVDTDPYPVVADGRITWVLDGYTVTDRYPLSQRESLSEMTDDSLQDAPAFQTLPTDEINYIRNSVKATVDAYDGTVTLYAWDESDPMLEAWMDAFPGTVQPKSEIPEALVSHLRYPDDLFKVQRYQFQKYHETDAKRWFSGENQWAIPEDPDQEGTLQPAYRLFADTGEGEQWSLTTSYVPRGRNNLAAFMTVNSDATDTESYGRIKVLQLPNEQTMGPRQVSNDLRTNDEVRKQLLGFEDGGSKPVYGNLLTVPVKDSFMYVQPLYAQRTTGDASFPNLRFVLVSYKDRVGIDTTLRGAIADVLGVEDTGPSTGEVKPDPDPGTEGGEGDNGQSEEPVKGKNAQILSLLRQAEAKFEEADAAQRAGNTVKWARLSAEARELIAEAVALAD